jgi:hypothetical protein
VGSVGVPSYGIEVKLDNVNPATGEGKIIVRGDNVMLGYYKDPERTRSVVSDDGWLHTGDLACVDAKGRFFIKGRLSFVHQWSHYDVPRGNEGWDLITERYTLRENDLSLALIFGKQFVSKHGFVAAPFFGFCIPLWIDGPFHEVSNPGNSAAFWGLTTWGVKLGWAF